MRGSAWECVGVRGSAWECVGVCGSAWECVGVRGSAWEINDALELYCRRNGVGIAIEDNRLKFVELVKVD